MVEGDKQKEEVIHKKFDKYRMNGEWFSLSAELIDFIDKLEATPIDVFNSVSPGGCLPMRQCNYCSKSYHPKTKRSKFCRPTCRVHFSIANNSPIVAALRDELSVLKQSQSLVHDCCAELAAHEQNMAALRETLISRYPGLLDDLSEFFD